MTHDEYMAPANHQDKARAAAVHREYFGQFVTEGLIQFVVQTFTIERLKVSRDPHLNDIPLREWDSLHPFYSQGFARKRQVIDPEYKGGWSISESICVLKEAARQAIERAQS